MDLIVKARNQEAVRLKFSKWFWCQTETIGIDFFFNWSIVDLQHVVSDIQHNDWVIYIHICIYASNSLGEVVEVLAAQWCLTLCDPMDRSLPGSSVHGTLQARVLKWAAVPFSRGSSWPRGWTWGSCIGRFFYHLSHREALTSCD